MRLFTLKLPVLLVALLTFVANAQEVDSTDLNGEKVYVYPFKVDVKYSDTYWSSMDGQQLFGEFFTYESFQNEQRMSGVPDSLRLTRDEFNGFLKALQAKSFRKFKKHFPVKFGREVTREDFKMFARMRDMGRNELYGFGKEAKIFKSKKLKKAIRANPYPFMQQVQYLDQDITPMLDPIPDGKYIQYYQPFCMVQEDGSCKYIENQIAGYFTIKDNTLNGEATWVNLEGDTLKHGSYNMGLKTGEWTIVRQSLSYFDEFAAEEFLETGEVFLDYNKKSYMYADGVREGQFVEQNEAGNIIQEGTYDDGMASGEWKIFWNFTSPEYLEDNDGNLAMKKHYFLNGDDSLVVNPFLIRDGLLPTWSADPEEYNFYPDYRLPSLPLLYKVAFPKEENFELEEEIYDDSYSEMEYYDEGEFEEGYYEEGYYEEEYFDDYGGRGSWSSGYFEKYIYDPNADDRLELGVLFDSLGARPSYTGVYEAFYPNGQLAYRYELENGLLKEEPIIYWDNGNVHDKITYQPDSNTYIRTIYDYNGVEYRTQEYDSSGRFIYREDVMQVDMIEIDGLRFSHGEHASRFDYNIPDSVLEFVTEPNTLLGRSWSLLDTTIIDERYYEPATQTTMYYRYNLFGDTLTQSEIVYADGFDSWTGKRREQLGPFELQTIRSASLYEFEEVDSIPVLMVDRFNLFDIDADYMLYYKGQPLTGPMKYTFGGKKFKLEKDEVKIPRDREQWRKFAEAVALYKLEGSDGKLKKKYREYAHLFDNDYKEYEQFSTVYSFFFSNVFTNSFDISSRYYDDYYWENEGDRDELPYTASIEGYMLNGKPEGIWKSYDQFGKIRMEVNYSNGMLNGKMLRFDYEFPQASDEFYYEMEEDSLPEEKTYYLSSEYNYKNDLLDGTAYEYTWYGDIAMESNYSEGFRDGLTTERNDIAVSYSEFKDGVRDGYSRTYLTLPGQDSILLFDLNFQNGALQGESISYHTNGKISKRGFFLSGQPIEDYEGYDSLGFKYHYVKFEYGFPVEEKLWEENELSVRYTFNWEDSIEFIPMNLTESESLDALLVQAGLSGGWEYRPYYGRQTIVDKAGVDYHLTKYFPNDTISRDGDIIEGKKSGYWEFFGYDGEKLYEVNYFDTLLVINDSIKFISKGIYTDIDSLGNELFRAYIIEKSERFDCSHKDHYEVRQFYTISETDDSLGRMNGQVFNYYDNGTLQSYGTMKNGLPEGEWRYYDPSGKLNKYGNYTLGKRNGRWLMGDLSKTKYLGDICLNPNMPDIEEEMRYRGNFLDIQIINYRLGREKNREYYDINMNQFIEVDEESMDELEIEE